MTRFESAMRGMTMRCRVAWLLALLAGVGGMPDRVEGQFQIQIQGQAIQVRVEANDQDQKKDQGEDKDKGKNEKEQQQKNEKQDDEKAAADAAAEAQRRQLEQQIKQQAAHWEQQFTKLLYGDLELLRAICGDLPRESRRAIAKAGQQAVKDAALRMAELPNNIQRRRGVKAGAAGEPEDKKTPADPVSMLSTALEKSVAEHVGKEQATAFADQLTRRQQRRREAMVREVVAALDGELFLTAGQRQAIEQSLRDKWNDSMNIMLQGVHINDGIRVFPGLPDDCVRPHLSEAQRKRFIAQPQLNNQGQVHWRQQAYMQAANLLNNVHAVERDPWWFE